MKKKKKKNGTCYLSNTQTIDGVSFFQMQQTDVTMEEKLEDINKIKGCYAVHLFGNKKFREAMEIFMQLETGIIQWRIMTNLLTRHNKGLELLSTK